MIYLAKNEDGSLERIQVVCIKWGTNSCATWGALNENGTEEIVPFSHKNVNYESVLLALQNKYPNSDIKLSKRIVDSPAYHIVCIKQHYFLYNVTGDLVSEFGIELMTFDKNFALCPTEGTIFPNYYVDVEAVHKNRELFSAYDIDTGKWVCFLRNAKVVSQSDVKEDAILKAVRRLS